MSTPFLTEIRVFSFNFAPKGWAMCNGQLLPINQNQAIFSLLGTTYGGDGRVNFGLPNLQGRTAMHMGQGHVLGERAGQESHTVSMAEMPAHIHPASADSVSGNATAANPQNNLPANPTSIQLYSNGSSTMVSMSPQMVTSIGGSQPHENRQPYLALNFCIALVGIFPTRN
ncbi:MAG: tail fiber protein [Actinomycetota bacterium]|nr:tail fiber protein [Actinomycetota bacterium]